MTKALLSRLAKFARPYMTQGMYANLGQWHSRYLHDPDFAVFDGLANVSGLVLDIGANRGHSALSILRHTRQLRVLSIEPNPDHRWDLFLLRLLHPLRFNFKQVAAGSTDAQKTLYVPGLLDTGQSVRGSIDPDEFRIEHVRANLAELGIDSRDELSFQKILIRVMPLDKLSISPDLIKLDVEGFELQALQGLQKTLTRNCPALLIEANHPERWLPLIKTLGYDTYCFEPSTGNLNPYDNTKDVINIFCLHPDNQSQLTQNLFNNLVDNQQVLATTT